MGRVERYNNVVRELRGRSNERSTRFFTSHSSTLDFALVAGRSISRSARGALSEPINKKKPGNTLTIKFKQSLNV